MIMAEQANEYGRFIDIDQKSQALEWLLSYLLTVGDFHRRPVRSGGYAVRHMGVLYVLGGTALTSRTQ